MAEDGVRGLGKGWAPTFFGYSAQVRKCMQSTWEEFSNDGCPQGLCKFGLYEVFKVFYSGVIGEENSYQYRTWLYLASSASAEFFADIALSPMEAAKVKIKNWETKSET